MTFKLKKGEKYIFASDLDGTFLTDFNSSLHIDSYEAVRKIQESKNIFVIATGRSWWWTKTLYEQLESVDASIHFSGAIVHHPNNSKFEEFRSSISQIIIKDMVKKIKIWDFANEVQAVGRKNHAFFSKGDDLNKLFFNCYEYIISFSNKKINPDDLIKKIEDIIGDGYMIRVWNFLAGEDKSQIIISPKGTSKEYALKKLSDFYGVPQKNVIYFGDNVNDLEALEWAGYSFTPKNAKEIAKKAANEVLDLTNDQGAVPKKIIDLLK